MDEEILKRIEERLTRLEAGLAQGATAAAVGPGGGPGSFVPPGGFVVDPAPWGGGGGWISGGWGRPPGVVVDPAPWGGGGGWGRPPVITAPSGPIGDPAPFDISRFTLTQLETSLHSIAADKARLDSTEKLIKERIKALKPEG